MKKLLYNLMNVAEWLFIHYIRKGNMGLLHHKEDSRDKPFLGTGEVRGMVDYGFRFHQKDNICVFASRELGRSQQDGVQWSVRFQVKLARKLKMTKGNGYSYLRAANEIAQKYGRLPYVLMPDEQSMGWEEYSRWTKADEELLKIAAKYTIKDHGGYSEITNDKQAILALNAGHSIFTAVNWYSAMNRPKSPGFWLQWAGSLVGGHAIVYDEKETNRFCNLQTFGAKYGDNGYAYTKELMPNIIGGAYVEAHYPTELLAEMVSDYYEGLVIRDIIQPECYVIREGKKEHIKTMEELSRLAAGKGIQTVAREIINLIPNA
jgi:hypothetical protein